MSLSNRSTFALLLAVALIALATSAHAASIPEVSSYGVWTGFRVRNVGDYTEFSLKVTGTPGYVVVTDAFCPGDRFQIAINGRDQGQTSAGVESQSCSNGVGSDPDKALARTEFSHGVFTLPAGTSTIRITATNVVRGTAGGFLKIGPGTYVDPVLTPPTELTVVTSKGKVSTRAEAIAACASKGMELAAVTAANWAAVVKAVGTDTAISLNPTDAVLISSWNGDSYVDSNLQLTVRMDPSGTIYNGGITLVTGPHYPLCQPAAGGAIPPVTLPQRSGDLAVVGPAGRSTIAARVCVAALGATAVPVVLSAARLDEFQTASRLAFSAAGANAEVWIDGWEEHSNEPLVLATGAQSGAGAVVVPEEINSDKLYLCKLPSVTRRSEL
ncbi:hypothetical protein GGF31_006490 [Allomyces arbusculus]|nr:hypothetical protein GGF31_006490 [Allomyces arbusculus]